MEMKCYLFCILNLFSFKFPNSREMWGSVAQTNVEEEKGAEGIRGGLA